MGSGRPKVPVCRAGAIGKAMAAYHIWLPANTFFFPNQLTFSWAVLAIRPLARAKGGPWRPHRWVARREYPPGHSS